MTNVCMPCRLGNSTATLVVLEATERGHYRVGNNAGVFSSLVRRPYLTPVLEATPTLMGLQGVLDRYGNAASRPSIPIVGTKQIAGAASASGVQGMLKCHCRKNCSTLKCSCRKAGRQCTSRCKCSEMCRCTNRD